LFLFSKNTHLFLKNDNIESLFLEKSCKNGVETVEKSCNFASKIVEKSCKKALKHRGFATGTEIVIIFAA